MACHPLCPSSGCLRTPLISPPKTGRPPRKPRSKTSIIGQPKSPWRQRKEEEALVDRSEDAVIKQIEQAIMSGHADKVIAQLTGVLALSSFSTFCQAAWHVVEPSTRLEWGRHHELICTTLQAIFEDWLLTKTDEHHIPQVLNTCLNVAPGSLKSRVISVFFFAWCWLRCPGMRFIYLSVNETAAMRDARAARDLIRSDWYQDTFKPSWSIKGDQDAVSDFGNTEGGGRLSQASGSEIVGLRGDCVDGATLVATEDGDIPIATIHGRMEARQHVPRVWSMAKSGSLELRAVQASRRIPNREVVDISTQSNYMLRCTDDHRIYTQEGYTQAALVAGRTVSVLPRTDLPVTHRTSAALSELSFRDIDVRTVQQSVPASWSGVRQEGAQRADSRAVLQQELQNDSHSASGCDAEMCSLSEGFQNQGQASRSLFSQVLPTVWDADVGCEIPTARVQHLSRDVQDHFGAEGVLLESVCERGALQTYDRKGKLELHRSTKIPTFGFVLAGSLAVDSRERQFRMHGVSGDRDTGEGVASPSRQRQSMAQRAGESNHVVHSVSHNASQAQSETVRSVNQTLEGGRRKKIDVYDIQVEGNHNFFASGICVSNCIIVDDANNPNDAGNKLERQRVNDLWDTNQYNRVNDPGKSLRFGIQQRTHADDWTGHILATQGIWSPENRNGWLHVVLPAEFELSRPAFRIPGPLKKLVAHLPRAEFKDWRTREGEVLHPKRMTSSYLAAEKKRWAGTGNYAGQMQQRPSSEGGGKIKKEWFGWFRLAGGVRPDVDEQDLGRPRPHGCHQGEAVVIHSALLRPECWDFDSVVLSVDPALKKTEAGSLWGMLAIGIKGARHYVLDDRSHRGEPDEAMDTLKDMVRYWRPDKILVEDKAGGANMLRTLEIEMGDATLPMSVIEPVNPGTQDKEMRVNAAVPHFKNGMVYLLDGASWVEDFVAEVSGFPTYSTDDKTDAVVQCVLHERESSAVLPSGGAWASAGF